MPSDHIGQEMLASNRRFRRPKDGYPSILEAAICDAGQASLHSRGMSGKDFTVWGHG